MIIIDKREPDFYFRMLKNRSIDVKLDQLEIGDFLLPDETVIERKTVNDLINSVVDGRIWLQASNLTQYKHPIILVESRDKWKSFYFSNTKNPHKIYFSAISAITYSFSIPVITLDSKYDTIDFVESLWKKITSEKPSSRPVKKMRKTASYDEIRENLLAQIPGISISKAKSLLNHFGTIQNITNANVTELKQLNGIGKKLAKVISAILQEEYKGEI